MTAPKDIDPYESPLHFFASQLRRHRLRLDLTQEQLGRRVNYSADTISKVETAESNPSDDLGRACDEVFGTHGDMEHLSRMVHRTAGLPSWMRRWLEFEQTAHTLRYWEPIVVPGLLQTEAYARELIKTYPWHDDEQVEELTAARMERQAILDRDDRPMLWVVIHENVLRCEVGDTEVMREQLQALIAASRRPRVTLQVVPLSAGMHAGHLGAFTIASVHGAPDVLYLENAREGQVTSLPADVQEIMNIWEAIRMEALPPRASLDLTEKVAQQWT